jgi:hypothetical protein
MKRYSPLLLVLALLGSLALSGATAVAATPSAGSTSRLSVPTPILSGPAFEETEEELDEEEGEEFETEECEAAFEEEELFGELEEEEAEEEEFEFEEEGCEEGGKEGADGTVTAPAACLVHRAESTITTLPGADRVDLTVHYATWSPAAVSIGLKLKDGKGTLSLEHATKHFGLGGTLHLSAKVSDAVMERAAKAKEFDVSLRAAKTPGFCGDLLEQQLKASKPVGRARVYSDAHGAGHAH